MNLQTVILAGGYGTRLAELTETIPKPMVQIGGVPIIEHIMNLYGSYGHNRFLIAGGYKSEEIKKYFLNYNILKADLEIDLNAGLAKPLTNNSPDWNVKIIDTGEGTLTGLRIKRLESYIEGDRFFLTYGDGVSNVDLDQLLDYHIKSRKLVTMTAVRPNAKFGELSIGPTGIVEGFEEKPQLGQGWVNGGFFVMEKAFLDYFDHKDVMLEREPLQRLLELDELSAFQHEGFWKCMDTKKDRDTLEELCVSGDVPWRKNN